MVQLSKLNACKVNKPNVRTISFGFQTLFEIRTISQTCLVRNPNTWISDVYCIL